MLDKQKALLIKFSRLIGGIFVCAIGITMMVRANIGVGSWDILHTGIAKATGISYGIVTVITGVILFIIDLILGEKFGIGTIADTLLTGTFIEIIFASNIIPVQQNMWVGIIMMLVGIVILSCGITLYMSAGLSSGPRDAFMVAITKKLKLSVGVARTIIEVTTFLIGVLLGGQIGIGTVICTVLTGPCIQFAFKVFKFDSNIEHESILDTFNSFKAAE